MKIEEWLGELKCNPTTGIIYNKINYGENVIVLKFCGADYLLFNVFDLEIEVEEFQAKVAEFIIEAINEKIQNDKIKEDGFNRLKKVLFFNEENIKAQEKYHYKLGLVAMKFLEYKQKTGNNKSKSFECGKYGMSTLILNEDYSIDIKFINGLTSISNLSIEELDIVFDSI